MENITDDIIKKASKGDLEAFEALYQNCCGFVYNVAWRMVSHHEDAQEVVQEVFLTVYRSLKSYRFDSSFKTWVYRVTVNISIDHIRKRLNTQKRTSVFQDQSPMNNTMNETEKEIEREHFEKVTQKVLDRLPEDQKVCVILRNIEGLSYQQIADTLEININTVRTRLKRAREALLNLRSEVMESEL